MRTAAPFLPLRGRIQRAHAVARQQAPADDGSCLSPAHRVILIFVVGRLILVERRETPDRYPLAVFVAQHAAFAAHTPSVMINAAHAGRPDHARGMELHKFQGHIHQRGTWPDKRAIRPSPVYSQLLLVISDARPIPPVASTTALARTDGTDRRSAQSHPERAGNVALIF